ncbi:hypothetical protein llap_5631 [Limosa lapponica baueri]|uniref:Uncharacterized protein n=1 Tax=Limosa lapponica baueri TaxID=1758121 RepID=A0A2I0UDD5_LIMLA|nr:hypothetical protein llap_5631 [Limosa lapponica baueri]
MGADLGFILTLPHYPWLEGSDEERADSDCHVVPFMVDTHQLQFIVPLFCPYFILLCLLQRRTYLEGDPDCQSPEGKPYPGLHQKQCGQEVKRGDSSSPVRGLSCETPPGVLHPTLECSAQEGYGPVGTSPVKGHEDDQRDGAPLL